MLCEVLSEFLMEAKTSTFCCCFNGNQFRGFDGGSVKIKGAKVLSLSVVPSKHSVSYIG